MFMTRRIGTLAGACAAALLLASPALAGSARTYQGVFAGDVDYATCTKTVAPAVASGRWTVVVRGEGLLATFNILVIGKHHVSYPATAPNEPAGDETFAGEIETAAGTLRISLEGSDFTYRIPDYTSPWDPELQCESVTYHGYLTVPR